MCCGVNGTLSCPRWYCATALAQLVPVEQAEAPLARLVARAKVPAAVDILLSS